MANSVFKGQSVKISDLNQKNLSIWNSFAYVFFETKQKFNNNSKFFIFFNFYAHDNYCIWIFTFDWLN